MNTSSSWIDRIVSVAWRSINARSALFAATIACAAFAIGADVSAPSAPPATLLRLELFVDDLPKSIAFYTDVLGFTVERKEDDYAVLTSGPVKFGLGLAGKLTSGHYFKPELMTQRRGLGTEIVIEVDDVKAAFDHVAKSGQKALSPLSKRPWGATDFRIADPDGYYLRVTSH